MLRNRSALNCAKWASRRLIGLLESSAVSEYRNIEAAESAPNMIELTVEAVDPDVVGDLPDHLDHGVLAAAGAEKRKHVDRPIDGPIDVLVDQGFEVFELALVEREMERA